MKFRWHTPKPGPKDAFFTWAEAQEGRYEFDGQQPVALPGASLAHGIILHNLQRALARCMHSSHYRSFPPNCWLETSGLSVRNPDGLIISSPQPPKARTLRDVVVVFEVVSPGTEQTDRIHKVREYAAVASIRRYVMIESAWAGLSVLERRAAADPWRATALSRADVLELREVGAEITVAELYDGLILDGGNAAGG